MSDHSKGRRKLRFPSKALLKRIALLVIPILLVWSPAMLTGYMVEQYSVNIPVWDDYERAPLLEKYESGELTLEFLVSPHIEHRILIPRLIILGNYLVGGGDLRNEVWVIFASMLASSICFALLILRTRGRSTGSWLLIFLVNLTIFTLMQYQNLCWAIQTAFLLPLMFLALTLLTLHCKGKLLHRYLLCLLWAVCGTFCFSHGLVLWLMVFGYLLIMPDFETVKKRLLYSGLWAVIAGLVFAWYFTDMHNVSHEGHSYGAVRSGTVGLNGLLDGENTVEGVLKYFFISMGSQFSRFVFFMPEHVAPDVGEAQFFAFLLLCMLAIGFCLKKKDAKTWRDLLPWIALGGFVCVSALVIALGRSHFAIFRSISPRYISITLYLTVSLLVLIPSISSIYLGRFDKSLRNTLGFVAAGVFTGLQLWNYLYGAESLKIWNAARYQSLTVLTFRDYAPPEHPIRLDFNEKFPRESIDRLKELGLFKGVPDPFKPDDFGYFKPSSLILKGTRGGIISVDEISTPFEGWRVVGFADLLAKMKRVADGVVFTHGEDRTIVGYGESFPILRFFTPAWDSEFSDLHRQKRMEQTEWTARIDPKNFPEGVHYPVRLDAWAIDFDRKLAYRISETVIIPAPADEITAAMVR